MGFSIAEELANNGADVVLISGPTKISLTNNSIKRVDVTSAEDMHKACIKEYPNADIIVMSAAVADYSPAETSYKKIKKEGSEIILRLKPTKDILSDLGKKKSKTQLLVGFALETDNEIEHAKKKLHTKNLDFIVMNTLKDKGAGFGHSTNKITIIDKKNKITTFELKEKTEVAKDIVNKIIE